MAVKFSKCYPSNLYVFYLVNSRAPISLTHFTILCGISLKLWSLAVLKKVISINPQLCWVKAVISLLTLGFAATSFSSSFPFYFALFLKVFGWAWERDLAFDSKVIQAGTNRRCLRWVDWQGNPVPVSSEVTANSQFRSTVLKVSQGEAPGDVGDLLFQNPEHFRAGKLHEHVASWKEIVTGDPMFHQSEVLSWIGGKVCVFPFFSAFLRGF